jgi:hypothetical protein
MTNCKTCNEPIEYAYTSAYGGDYYSSCNICDWHSEGDEHTTIKQGLTLEELVAHKKRLNKLYKDIHSNAIKTEHWTRLNILREIMDELLTTEELI